MFESAQYLQFKHRFLAFVSVVKPKIKKIEVSMLTNEDMRQAYVIYRKYSDLNIQMEQTFAYGQGDIEPQDDLKWEWMVPKGWKPYFIEVLRLHSEDFVRAHNVFQGERYFVHIDGVWRSNVEFMYMLACYILYWGAFWEKHMTVI